MHSLKSALAFFLWFFLHSDALSSLSCASTWLLFVCLFACPLPELSSALRQVRAIWCNMQLYCKHCSQDISTQTMDPAVLTLDVCQRIQMLAQLFDSGERFNSDLAIFSWQLKTLFSQHDSLKKLMFCCSPFWQCWTLANAVLSALMKPVMMPTNNDVLLMEVMEAESLFPSICAAVFVMPEE